MRQNAASYLPVRTVPLSSAIAVTSAIEQSGKLASLVSQARHSSQCLQLISQAIPVTMRPGVRAGALQDGQWSLIVANSAIAAKLRQMTPSLLTHLRLQGLDIHDIRIKVSADCASS